MENNRSTFGIRDIECPGCGKEVPLQKFCKFCGHQIAEANPDFMEEHDKVVSNFRGRFEIARKLEREGKIEKAKAIYEDIMPDKIPLFTAHGRLVILYRKEKDFENELRIILHVLYVSINHWFDHTDEIRKLTNWPPSERADLFNKSQRIKHLKRWKERLGKLLDIEKKALEKK